MSDFLDNLAERSVQPASEVQPRLLSVFEAGTRDEEASSAIERASESDLPERRPNPAEPAAVPSSATRERLADLQMLWSAPPPAYPMPPAPKGGLEDGDRRPARFTEPPHSAPELPEPVRGSFTEVRRAPAQTQVVSKDAPPPVRPSITLPEGSEPPKLPASRSIQEADANRQEAFASVQRAEALPMLVTARVPAIQPRLPVPSETTTRSREDRERLETRVPETAENRVVQITIGRLEIRASAPESRASTPRRASAVAPMGLEEYLRRDSAGRRV